MSFTFVFSFISVQKFFCWFYSVESPWCYILVLDVQPEILWMLWKPKISGRHYSSLDWCYHFWVLLEPTCIVLVHMKHILGYLLHVMYNMRTTPCSRNTAYVFNFAIVKYYVFLEMLGLKFTFTQFVILGWSKIKRGKNCV